jgi:hypothetical protein
MTMARENIFIEKNNNKNYHLLVAERIRLFLEWNRYIKGLCVG